VTPRGWVWREINRAGILKHPAFLFAPRREFDTPMIDRLFTLVVGQPIIVPSPWRR